MRQYFLILADSELEPMPREIINERAIINNARMRGKAPEKILLDASHHHPAFGKLPDSERRGRPDLVHYFLMLCIDSDLSAEGRLKAAAAEAAILDSLADQVPTQEATAGLSEVARIVRTPSGRRVARRVVV